jgi:hypothetical protein
VGHPLIVYNRKFSDTIKTAQYADLNQIKLLAFFLRQVMRNLHPDHRVIHTDQKKQKVFRYALWAIGPLKTFMVLCGGSENTSTSSGHMDANN